MKKKILSIVLILLISTLGYAQVTNPCGDDGNPDDTSTCDIPLDTWVYVLVIAGVLFGAYQLYKKQKEIQFN